MIKLDIQILNPKAKLLRFDMHLDVEQLENLTLQLPRWRPGRYEFQNFSKKILSFNCIDEEGTHLNYYKPTSNSWKISTEGCSNLVVTYTLYANQMDAGGIYLDEYQTYINFITCALNPLEIEDVGWSVWLKPSLPNEIISSLSKKDRRWVAKDYHQLVDSWLIQSKDTHIFDFDLRNYKVEIIIIGAFRPIKETLQKDFTAFIERVEQVFQTEYPHEKYQFLIQTLPYPHYHGVEHASSTVITLGPAKDMHTPENYQNLLGISSHEFFHVWNAKTMRPQEIFNYDYNREVYFDTGYLIEGLTTYYGDLCLVRSGALDLNWYMSELSKLLTRHAQNPARTKISVLDSSKNLWVDGYSRSIPKTSTSIYVHGALLALLLELMIRYHSNQVFSLDDVMVELLERSEGKGYTHQMYKEVVQKFLPNEIDKFFEVVENARDLIPLLTEYLGYAGLAINTVSPSSFLEKIGVRVKDSVITEIAPESSAFTKFSVGEEILSINNGSLEVDSIKPGENFKIRTQLQDKINEIELVYDETIHFQRYQLDASKIDYRYVKHWLMVQTK
jgi:predicted metalloprotease with PDZ domain